jgi:hypothetical protein
MCSKVEPFTDILSYSRYFIDTAWYGGYDAIPVYRYYGICYKIYRYLWLSVVYLFIQAARNEAKSTNEKQTHYLSREIVYI